MNIKIIITLLLLTSVLACKKKTAPIGDLGTVAFLFDGKINNQNVKLEAGKNDYFMNTNYFMGSQNLLNFQGTLNSITNKDSAEWLQIDFKNYTTSNNPDVNLMFANGDFFSFSADTQKTTLLPVKVVQFTFTGITQGVNSYEWNFGDGTSSALQNPRHIYTSNGKMKVSCLVKYANGLQDFLVNEIDVTVGQDCQGQFVVNRIGNNIQCLANPASSYLWTMPNGATSIASTASYIIPVVFRDYITLVSTSTSGCQSTFKQVVAPSNSTVLVNYNYIAKDSSYNILATPTSNYKTVILTYFKNGKTYTSFRPNTSQQSQEKAFTLISKELYTKNSAGQRTVKLNGQVDKYFYNTTNIQDSIYVYSNRLQLAVAFP